MHPRFKIALWILIFSLVFCKSFFGEHIISKALYDFDEARYAEVSKNILRTGNIITPLAGGPDEPRDTIIATLRNGEVLYPYLWKPPLHTLVIALSGKIFGLSELSIRFPSLLFAIGCLFLIYKITRKLFPSTESTAFIAILFFISTNDFSFLSSQGLAEMQLLFFSLLTIFSVLHLSIKSVIIAGISFGLAFLTKSFATFWVLPIVFIFFGLKGKHSFLTYSVLFIFSSCIVLLPWHIVMYIQFGQLFISHYILANTLDRTIISQMNKAPVHWYFIYLLDQWKPYVFIIPIFSASLIHSFTHKRVTFLFLLFWIAIIFVPFSLFKTKVFWYIFPLWVPLCILLAALITQAWKEKQGSLLIIGLIISLSSLLPYWQLSFSHIPIKQFTLLFFVVGLFFLIVTKRIPLLRIHIIYFVIPFLGIANYFTYQGAIKRTNWNSDIRAIFQKNQYLHHLAIVNTPYEAALYYSNAGNVSNNVTKDTESILTTVEYKNNIDFTQYFVKDQIGNYLLFIRR